MELAAFPPAREAKPALSRQQYGETLAGATATNTGKLHDMRTARFLPISAPSLTRDGWRRGAMVFTSLGLALLVAITDSASGGGYHLELLYFGPIALASWMSGRLAGLAVVAVSVASWHVVHGDLLASALAATLFILLVALIVRLREALRHADERFTAAMESLNDPVYVEDAANGEILYSNHRYAETFGAVRPRFNESGETQNPAADRWFVLRSNPLSWSDGRGARLCVLSDVTEERRARELLAKHRDAAHRTARLVALGEFASAIAHELNQPLAAIATYNHSCMRMLQSGNPDSGELQQAMHICRDQAKRAGKIIQRLRDLLRPPGPAFTEQNLNELVDAVLGLAEPAARDAGITFECRLAPTPPAVRADRLLVEQVALNLVRNAIEAVETLSPERRRITVATRLEVDGSGTFSVSDLGDGVPREAKERLFDPFVTTKPGGLGLGLSICRSVVEAHGGSIRHHHNDERGDHCVDHAGAVFAFTLPGAA
jgi:C4-dicarboxylate-specific signal transduction histidine kinase